MTLIFDAEPLPVFELQPRKARDESNIHPRLEASTEKNGGRSSAEDGR